MANIPIFEEQAPGWSAAGAEPQGEFKAEGFKAGYKPPAGFFNWFWTRVSRCIAELQAGTAAYAAANEADKGALGEDVNRLVTGSTAAGKAAKLATARTLSLTGDVTGSASFNGTANAAIAATVNTASQLRTARSIQTNLGSTAAASFNGAANIAPGVTGVLPLANGGTGRTDGRAAGINGVLPTSITTLWSGSAALWDYIALKPEDYTWFFINCNGFWMQGYNSGTLLRAFGVQTVGTSLRSATMHLQYSNATQWRYTDGHATTHTFGSTNSADIGALTLTGVYGMRVAGGVV